MCQYRLWVDDDVTSTSSTLVSLVPIDFRCGRCHRRRCCCYVSKTRFGRRLVLGCKRHTHTHAALLYFCLLTLPLTSSTIATVLARENVITKLASSLPLFDPLAPLSRHCGQLENQIDALSILVWSDSKVDAWDLFQLQERELFHLALCSIFRHSWDPRHSILYYFCYGSTWDKVFLFL